MSKNIQKAAYFVSLLAAMVVAFFGLSTVASAQSYDGYYYDDGDYGYYDDSYDPYAYYGDAGNYDDPYDGYYPQPDNWNDYGGYGSYNDSYDPYANSYDPYANSYNPYAYSGGSNYDQTCYSCGGSNNYYDDYAYNNTNDVCYYYDCSQTCTTCNAGSQDTIVDVWNYNVNTNTNTNYPPVTHHDDNNDDDNNNDNTDFSVSCKADDRTVEKGDRVRWIAEVDGVSESKVDFTWSGDADGDDQEVTEKYNKAGTYEAKVKAKYKGHTETDTCTVRVENDNNDDSNVTLVSNPPTGTPASLNSVYLSQVPYTGAADNAKLIGFITMLTLSSLAGAYYIVTRKARADRKSFIERFKQENYSTKA
ncbi:MAG: hypothetical protein RLY57_753 [Candidatus Parcubacteria bacterium]